MSFLNRQVITTPHSTPPLLTMSVWKLNWYGVRTDAFASGHEITLEMTGYLLNAIVCFPRNPGNVKVLDYRRLNRVWIKRKQIWNRADCQQFWKQIKNTQKVKKKWIVCSCVVRSFEEEDFLENLRILSCFVKLKSVLFEAFVSFWSSLS